MTVIALSAYCVPYHLNFYFVISVVLNIFKSKTTMKNMFYIITETYTHLHEEMKILQNYLLILHAVYFGNFCSLLLKKEMHVKLKR